MGVSYSCSSCREMGQCATGLAGCMPSGWLLFASLMGTTSAAGGRSCKNRAVAAKSVLQMPKLPQGDHQTRVHAFPLIRMH